MLLRATDDDVPQGYASEVGVVFDMLGPCETLLPKAVLEVIATLIDAGIATFLSVPGLPGWASGRVLLNPSLEAAVRNRDGDTMRARLVDAFLLSALHPKVPIELYAMRAGHCAVCSGAASSRLTSRPLYTRWGIAASLRSSQ